MSVFSMSLLDEGLSIKMSVFLHVLTFFSIFSFLKLLSLTQNSTLKLLNTNEVL